MLERDAMPGGGSYTMFGPGEQRIGGMYTREDVPPHWATYVGVDSADEAAARASELGAKVLAEPFDVMEMGRMAVIQDPTGAVIQVWQAVGDEGTTPPSVQGTVAWRELRTSEIDAAVKFYGEWLGWNAVANDMGDFTYYVFHKGELPVAGGMQLFGEMANIPAHWAITFKADDVDATFAAAVEHGAVAQMPPGDLPDVGRFSALADPQGVSFGIMKWADPER